MLLIALKSYIEIFIKPKTQAMFVLTSFIGLLERYQPPRGKKVIREVTK